MTFSFTTDYHVDPAVPRALQLQRVRAAGFTCLHWCWDWTDNVCYQPDQTPRIAAMLADAGLRLQDTHAVCCGAAREWAADPEQAAAGLALLRDRLEFTAALGGDTLVVHPPDDSEALADSLDRQVAALRSLDPLAERLGVRWALENLTPAPRNRQAVARLFAEFPPARLGFCFDSGHANLAGDTDWLIEHAFGRLAALHLHDNDGSGDQHRLPGDGTVDWPKVRAAIRATGYAKVVNLELVMRDTDDEGAFLAEAWRRAERLLG